MKAEETAAPPMTAEELEEAIVAFARLSGLAADDVRISRFSDLKLQLEGWKGAVADRAPTGLDRFEAWLVQAAKIMGPAGTIVGALAAGVGLGIALKNV